MQLTIYTCVILFAVSAIFAIADEEEDVKSSPEIKIIGKKKKKDRSTSSSSGADQTGESAADSLDMNSSGDSSDSSKKKRTKKPSYIPKSSEERQGWRKWHRKCKRCPEDMKKKWRDFSIKWICGEYQRAKRSFKSRCMMEYRNCQDGTMFVKVSDHRCPNQTSKSVGKNRGDHFFYEYRVKMSYESSDSKISSSSDNSDSSASRDSY